MSKALLDNVLKMTNSELNGLAKNRFIPADLQMAIARTGYKVAREHLSYNHGLVSRVRDYLWDDQPRGYVLKSLMVQAGHYENEPEKYIELYEKYPQIWTNCHYRATATFVGGYSWYGEGAKSCPSEVLSMAYDDYLNPKVHPVHDYYSYSRRSTLENLAKHPNCGLKLAIKLSTCGIFDIEHLAFKKIVQLS